MFIKLGIIAGIIILGGMIFSTEIDNLFPTTSATVLDSLKNDVTSFGSKASDSLEQRMDKSFNTIVDKTGNSISNEITEAGNKVSNEITDVKETSQKVINEKVSDFNPIESIQNIFTTHSNSENSLSSTNPQPIVESFDNPTSIISETLSLSTKQQSDDNILLQYSDSSGKTKNVQVIIRTAEKEIFSGIYFTSKFETSVNDGNGVPYYIDMIIEHEEYGTVTSSVFNPGDSSDSKIYGVFSQP
ncbi:hypothetical protein BD31_I0310 [Candidatus Nitrosopumilus salaria BD31]|uniref:Uncharacterized protein n=1 Tax=Candidatus Nitrosopumilus salarius BD31 TaxID=859350 RepID=I3D4X4_9ARCH|nr:hypothetical protein [Candidatus Nitrosopumilus salaria]EIJ66767.1 hypothetical protein BD31_I0310 [Candidatus Nitrosopumilus salaria BD31]